MKGIGWSGGCCKWGARGQRAPAPGGSPPAASARTGTGPPSAFPDRHQLHGRSLKSLLLVKLRPGGGGGEPCCGGFRGGNGDSPRRTAPALQRRSLGGRQGPPSLCRNGFLLAVFVQDTRGKTSQTAQNNAPPACPAGHGPAERRPRGGWRLPELPRGERGSGRGAGTLSAAKRSLRLSPQSRSRVRTCPAPQARGGHPAPSNPPRPVGPCKESLPAGEMPSAPKQLPHGRARP